MNKTGWAWALAIVALAFNPLLALRLNRDTWAFLDLAAAVLLLVSITTPSSHTQLKPLREGFS